MEERREALRKEFRKVGDEPPSEVDVLDACLEMAFEFDLSVESFCNKWTTFAFERQITGVPKTVLDVQQLRSQISQAYERQSVKHEAALVQPATHLQAQPFMTTDDFFSLQSYGIEALKDLKIPKVKEETRLAGGEDNDLLRAAQPRKLESRMKKEKALINEERSEKWFSRPDRGKVEIEFGTLPEITTVKYQVDVHNIPCGDAETVHEQVKYMFDDVDNMIENIRDRIRRVERNLLLRLKEDGRLTENVRTGPEAFSVPSQDPLILVGRIRCELEDSQEAETGGRINAKSVLLESEEGHCVKLDLQQVSTGIILIPGQIIAVEGMNVDGNCVIVTELHDRVESKFERSPKRVGSMREEHGSDSSLLKVLIAAGPFATPGTLSFQPLDDLLAQVSVARPNLLILIGPFADDSHSSSLEVHPEEMFSELILSRIRACVENLNADGVFTDVTIVPSLKDAFSDFVVPQPPVELDPDMIADMQLPRFASNPCILGVGNHTPVRVGLTSLPVVEDISAECMLLGAVEDRLGAICSLLIRQRHFYPLFPPSSTVPLDTSLSRGLEFPQALNLDLLIIPSRLKLFVKQVNDVICINPGALCKYGAGGTYAELYIDSDAPQNRVRRVEILRV